MRKKIVISRLCVSLFLMISSFSFSTRTTASLQEESDHMISDQLFLSVFENILLHTEPFNTWQEYLGYIKNQFTTGVAIPGKRAVKLLQDSRFKKRGSLQRFLKQLPVIIKPYETKIADNINQLQEEIQFLLRGCLFNAQLLPETWVEILLVNIAISDRKVGSISRLDQIDSDKAAKKMLKQWLAEIEQDMKSSTYQQEKKLQKNYMNELLKGINRLRLDPAFQRNQIIYGQEALRQSDRIQNPIVKQQATPIMYLLQSENRELFKQSRILYDTIKRQLFFDEQYLQSLFTASHPAFLAAIEDYLLHRAAQRIFDAQQFVREQSFKVKTISDLRTMVHQMRSQIGNRAELVQVEKALQSLPIDIPKILSLFKQVVPTIDSAFENSVRAVLQSYAESQKTVTIINRVIDATRERYKQIKDYVGNYFIRELEAELYKEGAPLPLSVQQSFKGLFRTPDSLRNGLAKLIGSMNVLDKRVTRQELRQWIEPYGLLCLLLQDWVIESAELRAADRFTMLQELVQALHRGQVKDQALYPARVRTERALINSGIYKGKLDALMNAVTDCNVKSFVQALEDLIERAGFIDFIRHQEEYRKLMNTVGGFLKTTCLELIRQRVLELNQATGEYAIPGIPLAQTTVYRALGGIFDRLVELVQQGERDSSQLPPALLQSVMSDIKNRFHERVTLLVKKERVELYNQAFITFIERLRMQIQSLIEDESIVRRAQV